MSSSLVLIIFHVLPRRMGVWLTWEKCVQHNIPIDQRSCSYLKLLKV